MHPQSRRRPLVGTGADPTATFLDHELDRGRRLAVTLLLRPRDPLPADAIDEAGDVLPHERSHIDRSRLGDRHGASGADIERVRAFAADHDLSLEAADPDTRRVTLTGSLGQIEEAFGTRLARFRSGSRVHRAPVGDASLPADLHEVVEWAYGLHDRTLRPRRPHRAVHAAETLDEPEETPSAGTAGGPASTPDSPASTPDSPTSSADGPPGAAAGRPGPGLYTALDVARMYDFPEGLDGSGETIGIVEIGGGYRAGDMEAYFGALGLPVPEIVDVGDNAPGDVLADMEVALDIQVAGAVAPGARIVVYFAEDASMESACGALARAVHDREHAPTVLSVSWGGAEGVEWTPEEARHVDELLRAAGAAGVTVCAASGDNGALCPVDDGPNSALPRTNFPAASPYALACGGTRLVGSAGRIEEETVWNTLSETYVIVTRGADGRPSRTLVNAGASSGGVSTASRPGWQRGCGVPDALFLTSEDGVLQPGRRFAGRGVPDVAGNADPRTAYRIFVNGRWRPGAGTSAVAPLWAGLVARLNQGLGHRVGFLNPLLYRLQLREGAEVFRQVDSGNNGAWEARAGRRWNPCTGLGSPRGTRLLEALRAGR